MCDIYHILQSHWGYSNFRPKQEEIIQSVLKGRDTLALLATGGGKSLCYQVPALCSEGIALVITPLIALMKDQVENLKAKGITAVALYSGLNRFEQELAINQCLHGNCKMLYLSPERLQSRPFHEVLQQLNINLIAVDEAHCISQWGYDFRPTYLQIADIRPLFPHAPILALTATATPLVAQDIQNKLQFKNAHVIQSSFARPNLIYFVAKEDNKLDTLLRIARKQKGSGIVYVRNRRKSQEISLFLQKNHISSSFYHAGLDLKIREKRQKEWKSGDCRIMVATNAFGMGIDKDNVRFVVHLDLPNSPEAYFQEAGRAGRDLAKAYAIVLWNEGDINKLESNFELTYPPLHLIKDIYVALGNYLNIAIGNGEGLSFDFDIGDFAKTYQWSPLLVYNALKLLENQGLLRYHNNDERFSRIKIQISGRELYRFQVETPSLDPLIKHLLRHCEGIFTDFAPIYETKICQSLDINNSQLQQKLSYLQNLNIIRYVPLTASPKISFSNELLDRNNINLSPKVYTQRKANALSQLKAMIQYVQEEHKCRQRTLLAYFEEKSDTECGYCDNCLKKTQQRLSNKQFRHIKNAIKTNLQGQPMSTEKLCQQLIQFPETELLECLQWLRDNGKVLCNKHQELYWNKNN